MEAAFPALDAAFVICPDATRSRDRADSPDLAGPRVICGRRRPVTRGARHGQ